MFSSNVNRMLLIFLAPLVHGSQNLDYSDLEAMDVACPERDQCKGYKNNLSYEDRSCECDFSCSIYNDCCIDAPRRSSRGARPSRNLTCLRYGEKPHSGVYVVSTCSGNWNGPQEVRQKCEGPSDFSDPVSAAPVTSISEGDTYKNLYCAECNNAHMTSLKMFQFRLIFKDLEEIPEEEVMDNLSYEQERGTWGVNRLDAQDNSSFTECEIIFDVPSYLSRSVRFCRANIISECAPDWIRQHVKTACEEYMAVVYDNTHAYRNPHCAICNHKTVTEVSCMTALSIRRKPFTFTMLIDLHTNTKTTPECPSNHIYDPYFKRCKRLSCALPGFKVVGGRCVSGG